MSKKVVSWVKYIRFILEYTIHFIREDLLCGKLYKKETLRNYLIMKCNNNSNNNIFNCKWAVARWQWLLCTYINEKYGSKKFKSGGLHEEHAVAS